MENSSKKVAVIGAGPMGLGVAYQLVRDGFEPVVFEADDRVGGMTATFDFEGLKIERYYHFHCTSDSEFLKVLDELNLADRMRWTATKMGYYFQGRVQPWGNPIALLMFSGLGWVSKFRYGLHAFVSTKRNSWRDLDPIEATGWIRKWVGEEAYQILWKKLFDFKFYHHTPNLSAAWIWSRIRRIGRSRYNLFKEKLGYLEGGSDTLLSGMRAFIESKGGVFRLSTPVEEVIVDAGKVKGLRTAAGLESFSRVISTVPLPFLPKLIPALPPELRQKYESLQNIAVVCVIAKLKKSVTQNFWLNVNDDSMDIPGLVEYSNLRPMDHAVVYVPFYMPAENPKYGDPDLIFIEKVKSYLMRINPALIEDDFISVRASRYRYAQPICPPKYLESLPDWKLPIEGLLAADTSYYYPEDRGISESIGFGRLMGKQHSEQE